jgi:hypothetical protein
MDAVGNIIPASKAKRSGVQWAEFVKRQIDEAIPVKMDANGTILQKNVLILGKIFPAKRNMPDQPYKRHAEPVILEVQPGTDSFNPVKTDAFGMISPG